MGFDRKAVIAGVYEHPTRWAPDKTMFQIHAESARGALHDAAILAPFVPTAMLFIASRDGLSHNPAEYSRIDDIVLAAEILYAAITDGEPEAA